MKKKKLVIGLFILFICLLSLTIYTSFSSNIDEQEIVIKSMIPVYDETSTIEVDNNNVVFNDKNQVVKYNVVLENTQDYDVKISDIKLSTPTEEFLDYKAEGISTEDEIKANSTKELTVSLETTGIKGWGRNFSDELTANISFEKVSKQEEIPPVEEEKQPEAPATNIEELISKTNKIEVTTITETDIEISTDIELKTGDKVDTWLYPDATYIGTHEVEVKEDTKKIVGIVETLKKEEVETGEHNIALVSQENVTLGYISVYVNEDKEVLKENTQNTTDKEESSTTTKPSTDSNNKEENTKDEQNDNKVENPYTSDKGLLVILVVATTITGIAIIVVSKNKFAKYTIMVIVLSSTLTLVNADDISELPITLNVSFESQNTMSQSYQTEEVCYDYNKDGIIEHCSEEKVYYYFWQYSHFITNIYVQNEISEIVDYDYVFDVTEEQNGRVMAYLAKRNDDLVCSFRGETDVCYDLYLQADGIIYANKNASNYFSNMTNLEYINNLAGIDTSEVTDMSYMFCYTGHSSTNFTLDLGDKFDTSKVTNMSYMFSYTGYNSTNFTLDLGDNFDTSKVTDMSYMFHYTGRSSTGFTLDLGDKFDTSNVTNMSYMFYYTGHSSTNFTLDLGDKFDTSNVTDMSGMFGRTGYSSTEFTLDLGDKFDTSNVTNMLGMFGSTGYNSTEFTLDLGDQFDTSNVTDMSSMFNGTGYSSANLNISLTIKNPNTDVRSILGNTALVEGSEITVNYTNLTKGIANRMVNTKSDGANVVLGNMVEVIDDDELSIGDEVEINGEYFNVVSQTEDKVTLLPQYNLGTDYRQSSAQNWVKFADTNGWEYVPGPKEIDIQIWLTDTKSYVNEYVEYLKEELGDDTVTGDLITLKDLEELGCTVPSDYGEAGVRNCYDSPYGWIVNGQFWWTRSASSTNSNNGWVVETDGFLRSNHYNRYYRGVRPVITISKSALKEYLKA